MKTGNKRMIKFSYISNKFIKFKLTCIVVILISISNTLAQNGIQYYECPTFHFSFHTPDKWVAKEVVRDSTKVNVLINNDDDLNQVINIFAYKTRKKIELKKLASLDTTLYSNLGNLVSVKNNKELLFFLNSIEKKYQNENIITYLRFKSKANYGYVIMWRSLSSDALLYTEICNSFKVQVPFINQLSLWIRGIFSGIGGWILGIIGLILLVVVAYGIGLIGREIRKQIMIVLAANKMLIKFEYNKEINKKKIEVLLRLRLKSVLKIVMVVLFIIVFYLLIYLFATTNTFLVFLLLLVPLVMDYYGVFLTLSDDIEDYFYVLSCFHKYF